MTRPSANAFCISGMVASTTVNGGGGVFAGFGFASAVTATSRQGRSISRFTVILSEEAGMIA